MSNGDSLHKRGTALENQFFAELDAKLLEELKSEVDADAIASELSRVTGIKDPSVLAAIEKLGVSSSTLAALRVFPLVAVAWADGILEKAEKETLETFVSKHAISKESPAMGLLHSWLANKPADGMLDAWEKYAQSLVHALSDEDAHSLHETLINEIKTVAQASGGVLGWASISKGEHAVMNRISAALTK